MTALALVSSFSEKNCGAASYSRRLSQGLNQEFEVQTFDVQRMELMIAEGAKSTVLADNHINDICRQLPQFDLVNIQCELGTYGRTIQEMLDRLLRLCHSAKNLILTMHRIDIVDGEWTDAYRYLLDQLKKRPSSQPFHLLVHLPRERHRAEKYFGVKNVVDHPIVYLTTQERQTYLSNAAPQAWKTKQGFSENDIVIGQMGLINPAIKNQMTAIKALTLLPDQYKMVFVGGVQDVCIEEFTINPVVQEITDFIDQYDEKRQLAGCQTIPLSERIHFLGVVDDDEFYQAMVNVDFVALPYLEGGQSASAVLSLALELQKKIVASLNLNFLEYAKYFPNCFELFDIGNHHEMKQKILHYKQENLQNLKIYANKYTLNSLAKLYKELYHYYETCHSMA